MIRRRLTSVKRSEHASPEPPRRRISSIPSPSIPSDECDLSDDDLSAKLRDSFRAEGARVREAIRQAIGGDIQSIVSESLGNMNSRDRRRALSLLAHLNVTSAIAPGNIVPLEALLPDRWVAAHPEHRLEQREEESREAQARRRQRRAARRIAATQ